MRTKVVLKVNRYHQIGNHCAVAACSSLANYYNSKIKYKDARKIIETSAIDGLYTPDQIKLLNKLGIRNVVVVTADTSIFDFSWSRHTNNWKIRRLKKVLKYYKRNSWHAYKIDFVQSCIDIISNPEHDNSFIIDWDFAKWIRSAIMKGHPVVASINYTSFHKRAKETNDKPDDIKGEAVEHAFVIRGFDKDNLYIVDSSGNKTSTYNGFYKMKWEHLLVNIGTGDLLFSKDALK